MEFGAMQDMDSDLLNFDTFFTAGNDEDVVNLWDLPATSHDDDLLDVADLEPLSPQIKEEAKQEGVDIKQELTLDTAKVNSAQTRSSQPTPTATLPARFALLSTTGVYEPGFTTSPRGKRRLSQTRAAAFEFEEEEEEEEDKDEEEGDVDPFLLSGDDDFMPEFTDAELAAMVDSPVKSSTTTSPLRPSEAMPHAHSSPASTTTSDLPDVISLFNAMYENSQAFLAAQQAIDLTGPEVPTPASRKMLPKTSVLPINSTSVATTTTTSSTSTTNPALPFDYFSPSGYAAAANQFLDNYQQQVQPFFLNPEAVTKAAVFPAQLNQTRATNVQLAAAMAMANSAAALNMKKMSYGVPIAPLQRRSGSLPPKTEIKVAAPIKPRLAVVRASSTTSVLPLTAAATTTSANGKVTRLAITPDIADFKLVQIFHQFCDPATKVLTLPRFQQLISHHQVKDDNSGSPSSTKDSKHSNDCSCCSSSAAANAAAVVTPDAQSLFKILDINNVGALDLERFMHSFQICNRCTEAKRRAHQAFCASHGQSFTPSALERQLMEDVAPVVVRVVPSRFEGHKVKSCEHYQWTWCEGFEKTGNEKCRGTNRHDKCPKYLANCTLWKHKLPPKTRKPKMLVENVDSPTKKLKYFS